jgi:hypothetical protein
VRTLNSLGRHGSGQTTEAKLFQICDLISTLEKNKTLCPQSFRPRGAAGSIAITNHAILMKPEWKYAGWLDQTAAAMG